MKRNEYLKVVATACVLTVGVVSASLQYPVLPVVLDCSEIPEREPWGREGVRIVNAWYPRIAELLHSEGYHPPKDIHLKVNNPGKGVAATAGNKIFVAASWLEKEPGHGFLIHELVHVVQDYRDGGVGWLTEGIADYIRWGLYEEKPLEWFPVPRNPQKDYRQSYRVSAGFLLWLETERAPGIVKKLNAAAHEKRYSDELFEKETGTSLDNLWTEYRVIREGDGVSENPNPKTTLASREGVMECSESRF